MTTTRIDPRPVRVAVKALSTSNLTLSGPQTVDGVSCAAGDLVGALGQSDNKNGVYLVQAGAWVVVDPAVGTGLEVYALGGSTNGGSTYGCDTAGAIVWGTTSTAFAKKGSSGSAFDPANPGPIGGTTPAAVTGTVVTASTRVSSAEYDVVGNTSPSPEAGLAKLYGAAYGSDISGISVMNALGSSLILRMLDTSSSGIVIINTLSLSMADDETYDFDNAGRGGIVVLVAPAATGSTWGMCSFARNGATSLAGLVFSTFDTNDTDTKLCAYGNAGKLRVKNRLGSTQDILALIVQHYAN